MKIIGVIPARYASSRLPGKPLLDICGKPMIWWVYHRVIRAKKLSSVSLLIDDERIADACAKYNMHYIMTQADHPNHISRVQEAAAKMDADWFVCINGDEPLVEWEAINKVIPEQLPSEEPVFYGAARVLEDAGKVIDPANIKLVLNQEGRCIYLSRAAVPFPKGTLGFTYKKYVGIECFNHAALDFFTNHAMGEIERIEDIDHLRFLENQG